MDARRAPIATFAGGVVLMAASCSSSYYPGGDGSEIDDFERGAYETGVAGSNQRWATEEGLYDIEATAEAEMWADRVATENAIRSDAGKPPLTFTP